MTIRRSIDDFIIGRVGHMDRVTSLEDRRRALRGPVIADTFAMLASPGYGEQ
jgi:hypothetical protein